MSAAPLAGQLISSATTHWQQMTTLINRDTHRINQFGEMAKSFGTKPDVKLADNGSLAMSAWCARGTDGHQAIAAMQAKGFRIGTAIKSPVQFNDGYVIWTVPIHAPGMDFHLVFYTELDAA